MQIWKKERKNKQCKKKWRSKIKGEGEKREN